MTLTFGLNTIHDLFGKLQRDAEALNDEVTRDNFFNFVVTGYSLIDWVKNDPTVPAAAKTDIAVQDLYNNKWLKICGNLANASKHFKLTSRAPVTSSATNSQGYGIGRYGKGGYGVGEESIEIQLSDGQAFDCLELVQGVLNSWQAFFATHGI
jgi:hypothetical protein